MLDSFLDSTFYFFEHFLEITAAFYKTKCPQNLESVSKMGMNVWKRDTRRSVEAYSLCRPKCVCLFSFRMFESK